LRRKAFRKRARNRVLERGKRKEKKKAQRRRRLEVEFANEDETARKSAGQRGRRSARSRQRWRRI